MQLRLPNSTRSSLSRRFPWGATHSPPAGRAVSWTLGASTDNQHLRKGCGSCCPGTTPVPSPAGQATGSVPYWKAELPWDRNLGNFSTRDGANTGTQQPSQAHWASLTSCGDTATSANQAKMLNLWRYPSFSPFLLHLPSSKGSPGDWWKGERQTDELQWDECLSSCFRSLSNKHDCGTSFPCMLSGIWSVSQRMSDLQSYQRSHMLLEHTMRNATFIHLFT